MTSERKIRANRMNAQASTGPKTAQGRKRSARNALHHALNLPIGADPTLCAQVKELAQQIASCEASPEIQELARQVAESQIDLRRVRDARHRLMTDPTYDSAANTRMKFRYLCNLMAESESKCATIGDLFGFSEQRPALTDLLDFLESKPQGPEKLASILVEKAGRLLAMDRYEGRARSRRMLAVRALDAARMNRSQKHSNSQT